MPGGSKKAADSALIAHLASGGRAWFARVSLSWADRARLAALLSGQAEREDRK